MAMHHVVIYVPGLGDHRTRGQQLAVSLWRFFGVQSEVFHMRWLQHEPFEAKLRPLLARIDALSEQGRTVSLVGVSAGGGAVINAYALRQDVIHRVVCVCGKLTNPQTVHPRVYEKNPGFAESMEMLPSSIVSLSKENLSRVRSIRALADESVPPKDTIIEGTEGFTLPTMGHVITIGLAITIFSSAIIGFIKRP